MKFNSYEFLLLFLPGVLAIFFALGRYGQRKAAMVWLVAASLGFYAYWNPAYLGLILGSILFNFTIGERIARQAMHGRGHALMALGVVANLGLLGYYKYANFFVESVNAVSGTTWQIEELLLPLAISFFTFQQIAYLVDAWKGTVRDYSFLHYCLFVSFFPQLIAGPIVHHKEMMPQFDDTRRFVPHADDFAIGLTIFILGLAKKTLIADELALYADPVFSASDAGLAVSMVEAWGGVLAYTLQIYFDFSGYSDMAIGLARLFGVYLPLNFYSPYRAGSMIEFWQRWHMTLSRFLRDYLYIPLGGNRCGNPRRVINVMATMLLGGLWHGAGWNFIIWGGLHGVYLVVNQGWRTLFPNTNANLVSRFLLWGLTFLCVAVAWVFFRAETFGGAMALIASMFAQGVIYLPESYVHALTPLQGVLEALGIEAGHMVLYGGRTQLLVLAGAAFVAFVLPNTQQIMSTVHGPIGNVPFDMGPILGRALAWRPSVVPALLSGIVAALAVAAISRSSPFLYFNF
jgi:D-alanyl-lipoteichoic acid acyltransferase DltB (MBOAT superfamily)